MEDKIVKVKVKNIGQSPLKLRLVVDTVRGKGASEALDILKFVPNKGKETVEKAINSGIANARDVHGVDKDQLVISKISADGAKILKRTRFGSRGRVSQIDKRRSHLNLELKVK